jgi:hypothetical protein
MIMNLTQCESTRINNDGNTISCSWIEVNKSESCIKHGTGNNCTDYTTAEECDIIRNGEITTKCTWVGVIGDYSCVSEGGAEFCGHYLSEESCTQTVTEEVCEWNNKTKKCDGKQKQCDEFLSWNGCESVNEGCWWNGLKHGNGKCMILEGDYTCSNLSKYVCENYLNINGLTITDEPCFFNGISEENGNSCVSADSMRFVNISCGDIKTNEQTIPNETSPKFCDNAQLLFGISGMNGYGCYWDDNNTCLDMLDTNISRTCSEYKSIEQCNYHFSVDEGECFWNDIDKSDEKNACKSTNLISNCSTICTNDVAGINSHFCSGGSDVFDISSEICRWSGSDVVIVEGCNCEGIEIPPTCKDLFLNERITPSECKTFKSEEGNCFFNGNTENYSGEFVCSSTSLITKCGDLLDSSLCKYAKKYIYINLESSTSSSFSSFLCLWDYEEGVCESKGVGKTEELNKDKNSFQTILIIIITSTVVVLVLVIIFIIIVVIVLRRSKSRILEKEQKTTYEMTSMSNGNLPETKKKVLINDYTVGEMIGKYKIEKIIGRGITYLLHYFIIIFHY